MKPKKTLAAALLLCLLCALLSPAARAAGGEVPVSISDRWSSLLDGGMDALTEWFDGQAEKLTPELRETLRDLDTDALFADLRDLAARSRDMDDAELQAAVLALAQKHGMHLVDSQVTQLMDLCRTLEKLDPSRLQERFSALGDELNAPLGLRGAWDAVKKAVSDAAGWIAEKLSGLFR